MSNVFTAQSLQTISAPHDEPCISLLMPTHSHGPATQQDPVRFKNLLRDAAALLSRAYDARRVKALLDPVTQLAQGDFWRGHAGGLAVYRSPDMLEHYRVPLTLPERVVVADSFHLGPLVKLLGSNQRFFVLSLSQNSLAIYAGTPYSLDLLDLPELPDSLTDALGIEEREAVLSYHVVAPGRSTPIYHGHGVPAEENTKTELERYFRVVDHALWEALLRDEQAPLILVGVGYLHAIYRGVSRYPFLAASGVEGNFSRAHAQELHAKVWPVARQLFQAKEDELLRAYDELKGKDQVADDLATVAKAAIQGRVRCLLVEEGAQVWGEMNRTTGGIAIHEQQEDTRDEDLLDDLAELTLAHRGEVLMLDAERMPEEAPAAALLRW